MRGRVITHMNGLNKPRITPAYAGKSLRAQLAELMAGDHPRVCGEESWLPVPSHNDLGSPPRMRGRVFVVWQLHFHSGITPAYAGKSAYLLRMLITSQDHPRVCGEEKSN